MCMLRLRVLRSFCIPCKIRRDGYCRVGQCQNAKTRLEGKIAVRNFIIAVKGDRLLVSLDPVKQAVVINTDRSHIPWKGRIIVVSSSDLDSVYCCTESVSDGGFTHIRCIRGLVIDEDWYVVQFTEMRQETEKILRV